MGRSAIAIIFGWTLLLGWIRGGHGFVSPRRVVRRRFFLQIMKAEDKEQMEVVQAVTQVVDSLYSKFHRTEDRLGLAIDRFDRRLESFQKEQTKELQELKKEQQEFRLGQQQLRNLFIAIPVIAGVLANLSTVLETFRKLGGK